jgi:hypothetical protein
MNKSKKHDPRIWGKWRESGAVVPNTPRVPGAAAEIKEVDGRRVCVNHCPCMDWARKIELTTGLPDS